MDITSLAAVETACFWFLIWTFDLLPVDLKKCLQFTESRHSAFSAGLCSPQQKKEVQISDVNVEVFVFCKCSVCFCLLLCQEVSWAVWSSLKAEQVWRQMDPQATVSPQLVGRAQSNTNAAVTKHSVLFHFSFYNLYLNFCLLCS